MSRNDDSRMRNLVDRLLAMSPQPPPYPEEVTMTTTPSKSSRRNPALVFAAAAVLVLLGAAIPLLLMGDRGPDPIPPAAPTTTTTTVPPTTETAPTTTEPAPTTTVTTTIPEPPPVAYGAMVFLVQDPENSFTGNPAIAPFLTFVPGEEGDSAIRLALELLGDPDLEAPPGFESMVPQGLEVLSVDDDGDGVITVDMGQGFTDGAGGLLADITMLNQMVYTATQGDPGAGVLFTVGGEPVEAFGSEGLILTDPVGREDLLDHLNLVILTSPILPGEDGRFTVVGLAAVFEATVNLQIVDLDGAVVHEEFTTATCGGPCWGEYGFELDHDFTTTPGAVRVFWYSAEDGEPANVVTVPVSPGGGVWRLLPLD